MATQYSNKPIVTDGLVYALDFGNQKSYVSGSVFGNNLKYSPTTSSFLRAGNPGGVDVINNLGQFTINGTTGSYVTLNMPSNPIAYGGVFTLMYIGKPKSGDSGYFYGASTGGAPLIRFSGLEFDASGYYTGRAYTGDDSLKFVTVLHSSGSYEQYVNGIPQAPTGFSGGSASPGDPPHLSGRNTSQFPFTGSLGCFLVYNRKLTADEIWQNYQILAPKYGLSVPVKPYSIDPNAYLFLSQSGITDPIITSSIDTFVRGLKSAGIWDKMVGIYPFVGTGSAGINLTGSHRWNLKEPSTATYGLTFTGTWIGSTSGSTPSGSNTNITIGQVTPRRTTQNAASSLIDQNNVHISFLSYDTPVSRSYLMGTGMTEDLAASTLAGDYGTPAAAYSVRKVRTAYTGALMDVRRSYDNVTSSIGFVSNGDLDTGSLLDWVVPGRTVLPGAYSGLAAAYSLRRVSASYAGSAIDVRRGSDNYIFPIGFTGSGDLDTQTLLLTLTTGSNIIPYSNDFTQADWFRKDNIQVTASAIPGPFGVGSGSFLNETSATGIRRIAEWFEPVSTSSIHNISVFVKKQGRRYFALGSVANNSNNSTTLFDLDTTSSLFSVDNGTGYQTITSSIHYVDDGWFRLSHTFTQGRTDLYPLIYIVSSSDVYSADPASYVGEPGTGSYIYGFQYTTGSILQPYIETTGTAKYNQPLTSSMGHVTKWYDQSGNNRHATQTATGSQPLIVSSGSLVTSSGRPTIDFSNGYKVLQSDNLTVSQPYTTFTYVNYRDVSNFPYIFDHGTERGVISLYNAGGGHRFFAGNVVYFGGLGVVNTPYLYYALFNTANSQASVNGVLTSSVDIGNVAISRITIGGSSTGVGSQAYISEHIEYHSDQSANRPLIENNINNYYNIYTGSNHGFVARWYDQSGNNRHATQSVAVNQPLIVLSGSLITRNSRPIINFTTQSQLDLTSEVNVDGTDSSLFMTYEKSATGNQIVLGKNGGKFLWLNYGSAQYYGDTSISNAEYSTNNDYMLVGFTMDYNVKLTGYKNNIVRGIATSGFGTNQRFDKIFDRVTGATGSNSFTNEIIVYPTDQDINTQAINYGINSYYNIYTQPSASFATSSFTISAASGSVSASLNNRLTSGIASSGPLGLITVSRTGSNSLTIARNGVTSSFAVPASGALSTGIYLGAINNNGIALGNSPLNISFASVGTGLTNREVIRYGALVNTLNYNLGRSLNSEYLALLNYARTQGFTLPSPTVQAAQNQLLTSLKASGVWQKLDTFFLCASDGSINFACLNWKNPGVSSLNPNTSTSTILDPNRGLKKVSSTDSGYIDAPLFTTATAVNVTTSSAAVYIYEYEHVSGISIFNGLNNWTRLRSRDSNAGDQFIGTAGTSSPVSFVVTSFPALKSIQFTTPSTITFTNQKTQYPNSTVSTAITIPGSNYARIFEGSNTYGTVSLFAYGASLLNENSAFVDAIDGYFATISS